MEFVSISGEKTFFDTIEKGLGPSIVNIVKEEFKDFKNYVQVNDIEKTGLTSPVLLKGILDKVFSFKKIKTIRAIKLENNTDGMEWFILNQPNTFIFLVGDPRKIKCDSLRFKTRGFKKTFDLKEGDVFWIANSQDWKIAVPKKKDVSDETILIMLE